MKKLFVLFVLFTTVCITRATAQPPSGDPAAMMQRYKDRVKPQLVEKAKLTEAEADKVIEINFRYRAKMRELRDVSEEDKKKTTESLNAAQTKEYTAIPLTEAKVKAVNEFFEEQRKEMEKRRQNGGGGGN